MNNIGEKIKNARKAKGLTQDELAELLDLDRASISNYERGRNNPPYSKLGQLSDILGIKLVNTVHDLSKSIPFIGLTSKGVPKRSDLDECKKISIDNRLFREGMYAAEAEGYSMASKINDGNIVYCSPNDRINDGSIVHYTYNGESGIRRYRIDEEQNIITLVPLNPDYNIIVIDEYDSRDLHMVKVIGVVDTDF